MRPTTALRIPQPCHESWAAMTPAPAGRHCAACAKTVVDFTTKTDAELLAYFSQPSEGTCGRLWADQLARPLRSAGTSVPTSRWRSWLAAAAAVWGLREATAWQAAAKVPTPVQQKKAGRAVPRAWAPALLIRGVVRDAATNEPVPGVAVFLQAENRRAITDSAGFFSLRLPAGRPLRVHHALVLHLFGYESQTVAVPASAPAAGRMAIALRANGAADGVEVTGRMPVYQRQVLGGAVSLIEVREIRTISPTSEPVNRFFRWLTRPFHRKDSNQ